MIPSSSLSNFPSADNVRCSLGGSFPTGPNPNQYLCWVVDLTGPLPSTALHGMRSIPPYVTHHHHQALSPADVVMYVKAPLC